MVQIDTLLGVRDKYTLHDILSFIPEFLMDPQSDHRGLLGIKALGDFI